MRPVRISGRDAQPGRLGGLREEKMASLRAAIEQQVERRQPGDERRAAALRVYRMPERLPRDLDAGALECLALEYGGRAAHAAEEGPRAQPPADVEDQRRLRALHAELGAAHER